MSLKNRHAFRQTDEPLCEWNPDTDRPAMLADPFHALATVTVGSNRPGFRVCEDCANRPAMKVRPRQPLAWVRREVAA